MLETPALSTSEGIFRRPGNLSRSRQLYNCLKDSIASSYLCVPQPSPPRSPSLSDLEAKGAQARSPRRNDVYGILHRAQLYDVASVLLRCLSTAHPKTSASSLHLQAQMLNSAYALVPPKATDLFVQATQLQYHLKDRRPVYALNPSEDWVHLLCHGRQILAYRIIIQLLLPAPERHLLVKLVSLLHKIAANSAETRMSPAALARCLAVAVFGLPDDAEAMGHYIDTLTNLIELSEELETLPAAVYKQVRGFLKSKLGSSPARFAADRLTDAETECTASGTPLIVDRSAMKRSWDTCQVNVDIKRAEIIKQVSYCFMEENYFACRAKEAGDLMGCLLVTDECFERFQQQQGEQQAPSTLALLPVAENISNRSCSYCGSRCGTLRETYPSSQSLSLVEETTTCCFEFRRAREDGGEWINSQNRCCEMN